MAQAMRGSSIVRCVEGFAEECQGGSDAFSEFKRCRRVQIAGIEGKREQLQRRLDGGDAVVAFQFVDCDLGQGGESEPAFDQFHQG